jgi:hypothetical protein
MIAEEYADILYKDFWCFETYTETSQEFAERIALKNALKHCYHILETDPSRDHSDKDFYQHKLGVDVDFYTNVAAILEERLKQKPI